jgi:Type II intron maturase/Reverse transcriptase (RNA-dependent DNA polymerase)
MKKLDRLIAINTLSKNTPAWVHEDIFRLFRLEDLWILAYENLKSSNKSLTPGIDHFDTLDVISLERLKDTVCNESYRFTVVKFDQIPMIDNFGSPSVLPNANDKIVQEIIRIILDAIYEPIFSPTSFGFRLASGYHEALNYVENKFRSVDWIIKGDIDSPYPTINHSVLVECLSKRIKDHRFINLIWKLLKSGVLENSRLDRSGFGVSQRSVVFPILVNIYYHELDEYIATIFLEISTRDFSKLKSPSYKFFEHKIETIHEKLKEIPRKNSLRIELLTELRNLKNQRTKVPILSEPPITVEYVRYAEDWMVGITGNRYLAEYTKSEILVFTHTKLKQFLNSIRIRVTDIHKGHVYFLGYVIYLPKEGKFSDSINNGVHTILCPKTMLRLEVPLKLVLDRCVQKGYLSRTLRGIRPISRSSYAIKQDHVIVLHYKRLILGILGYYSGASNQRNLQYIQYLLQISCAMTLAHRHRMSCSKVFKKHGKNLRVSIPNTHKYVELSLRTSWFFVDKIWQFGHQFKDSCEQCVNRISCSNIGLPCIICDSVEEI